MGTTLVSAISYDGGVVVTNVGDSRAYHITEDGITRITKDHSLVESPYKPSRRIGAFQKRLESHGITATVRRSLGGDIDASCGQLRRKAMEEAQKGECSQ